jgi:hypothetical protein
MGLHEAIARNNDLEIADQAAREKAPFNPLTQVSADAKYIVRNLVLWFLVLPAVVGALIWALTR